MQFEQHLRPSELNLGLLRGKRHKLICGKIACRGALLFIILPAPLARQVGGMMNGSCALLKLIDTHECNTARGQSCRKKRPEKQASKQAAASAERKKNYKVQEFARERQSVILTRL